MFACLHSEGILPRVNDVFSRTARDGARTSAHSFNNLAEIPSGPVAFTVDKLQSNVWISSKETFENSGEEGVAFEYKVGIGLSLRGRKTEANNWLRASALAVDVVKVASLSVIVSGKEDLLVLDLKNFQNFFGFDVKVSARLFMYSRFLVLIKRFVLRRKSRNFWLVSARKLHDNKAPRTLHC